MAMSEPLVPFGQEFGSAIMARKSALEAPLGCRLVIPMVSTPSDANVACSTKWTGTSHALEPGFVAQQVRNVFGMAQLGTTNGRAQPALVSGPPPTATASAVTFMVVFVVRKEGIQIGTALARLVSRPAITRTAFMRGRFAGVAAREVNAVALDCVKSQWPTWTSAPVMATGVFRSVSLLPVKVIAALVARVTPV